LEGCRSSRTAEEKSEISRISRNRRRRKDLYRSTARRNSVGSCN
jgi:hypothetical protein